ncbi:unnamed protein product [Closterium sp. NIES-54]
MSGKYTRQQMAVQNFWSTSVSKVPRNRFLEPTVCSETGLPLRDIMPGPLKGALQPLVLPWSSGGGARFVNFVIACLFFDAEGDLGLGAGGGEPGSLRETLPETDDGLFPTGSTGRPAMPSCAAESAFVFDSNPAATATWLGSPRFSPTPFPAAPPEGPPCPPAPALLLHPLAQPPRPPAAALRPHPPTQPPRPPAAALLSQNPAQPLRPPALRHPNRPPLPAARPPAPRAPLHASPYAPYNLDVTLNPRRRARSTHRSSSSRSSIPSSSPPARPHCRLGHSPCAELASMYPPRSPPPPPHSCTQPRCVAPPRLLPRVRHPLPLLFPPPPRLSFSKTI